MNAFKIKTTKHRNFERQVKQMNQYTERIEFTTNAINGCNLRIGHTTNPMIKMTLNEKNTSEKAIRNFRCNLLSHLLKTHIVEGSECIKHIIL